MTALEANKTAYDKQLFSDWVMKVYDRCRIKCVVNPGMYNSRSAEECNCSNHNRRDTNKTYANLKNFAKKQPVITSVIITDYRSNPHGKAKIHGSEKKLSI